MVSFIPADDNDRGVGSTTHSTAEIEILSTDEVLHIKVMGNPNLESRGVVAVAVDRQVRRHGRLCVLFEIHDRDGAKATAMWQDETSNFKVQSIDCDRLYEAKLWLKQQLAC